MLQYIIVYYIIAEYSTLHCSTVQYNKIQYKSTDTECQVTSSGNAPGILDQENDTVRIKCIITGWRRRRSGRRRRRETN